MVNFSNFPTALTFGLLHHKPSYNKILNEVVCSPLTDEEAATKLERGFDIIFGEMLTEYNIRLKSYHGYIVDWACHQINFKEIIQKERDGAGIEEMLED